MGGWGENTKLFKFQSSIAIQQLQTINFIFIETIAIQLLTVH